MTQSVVYALTLFLAGFGIPIMASMNSALGIKLQAPLHAVVILLGVGFVAAFSVLILFGESGVKLEPQKTTIHLYAGGLLIAFYLVSVTFLVPKFGVANSISIVVFSQLISIAVIEHFGLFGSVISTFSVQRGVGLALMALGVVLVVNRS